jgi:ketosteroid isomerase-like protein
MFKREEIAVSMSRKNLEVVVAWLDAMRRRDLAAITELLQPGVVWRALPADAVCHNRDDVLEMLEADELHEGLRSIDALELVAGDGTVVLGVRSPELQEIGDVALTGQLFNVFALRDGRIASIQDYATRDEALRAAHADAPGWA